jgi:Ca-activated chloride channel family protein
MLDNFHFLRPEWLFAFIPLIIVALLLRFLPKHQADWEGIISPHLLDSLFPTKGVNRVNTGISALFNLCAALCIIAAAGPTVEKLPQPVFSVNEGHVVVMDMSLSMRSTDVAPDRLTRAKFKAIDLIKTINEGEIGVVAYAGEAFTISPLTEDISTLEALIPSLSPEIMPVKGSDAYLGLTHAADLLLQAGYPNGKIYWITDGVDAREAQELQQWVNDTKFQINILAVGTKDGAPISLSNGELLKDATGSIVIPKMRFSTLAAIARQSGGNASELTTTDSDVKAISSSVLPPKAAEEQESNNLTGDQWRELGPWLLAIALPFAAYLFRKGLVAVVFVSLVSFGGTSNSAFAQESDDSSVMGQFTQWFKNADQQGFDAYNQEQYERAANTFKDPMWEGAAHYKNGNYDAALDAFSQVDSAQSWYNRGNTLAQQGKLEEASEAYQEALNRKPEFSEAAENKALVDQLKEQQENQENQDSNGSEQQNDDQQQGDQNQQDGENQQQGDGSQDDQQQNQEGQQNQQGQQGENDESESSGQQNQQDSSGEEQQQSPSSQSDEQGSPNEQETPDFEESAQQPEAQNPDEQQSAVQNMSANSAELTDEEREKQQQIDALLRRIPNDPAFLLQRKMQLEAQKRTRDRRPSAQEKKW